MSYVFYYQGWRNGTFKTHFELVAKLPHRIGFPAGRTDSNGIISVVHLLAVIREKGSV